MQAALEAVTPIGAQARTASIRALPEGQSLARVDPHDGVGNRLWNLGEIVRRARWDDDDVALGDLTGHPTFHAGTRPPGPRHPASASRVLTRPRIDQAATADQCAGAF